MDVHRDQIHEGGRVWRFRPYYWDPQAVFVHNVPAAEGGGMRMVEPTNEIVEFRADMLHALVPREYASQVVRQRSCRGIPVDWNQATSPKLVWRWVRPGHGEYVF